MEDPEITGDLTSPEAVAAEIMQMGVDDRFIAEADGRKVTLSVYGDDTGPYGVAVEQMEATWGHSYFDAQFGPGEAYPDQQAAALAAGRFLFQGSQVPNQRAVAASQRIAQASLAGRTPSLADYVAVGVIPGRTGAEGPKGQFQDALPDSGTDPSQPLLPGTPEPAVPPRTTPVPPGPSDPAPPLSEDRPRSTADETPDQQQRQQRSLTSSRQRSIASQIQQANPGLPWRDVVALVHDVEDEMKKAGL